MILRVPPILRPFLERALAWAAPGGRPRRIGAVELSLGGLLELLARVGYAARGFVYLSIGVIALMAALDWLPRARAGRDAVTPMLEWPLGYVWATAIGLGLVAFAIWRAAQVLLDADRQGRSLKALASRLGQAISGVVYAALALSVFELLDEVEDRLEGEAEAQQQAAEVLSWPGGQWLLIAAGLFVLGCGVGNVVQGVLSDFGRRLGCKPGTRRWACWCGRVGYVARGVAFLPLGGFFVKAGLELRSSDARDLGGALQALEAQPMGSLLLSLIAIGLMAFGVFALVEARFRHIDVPEPQTRARHAVARARRAAEKIAA
ncbi:MAG TPA: DUF1206 domain-containing protein [Caulobacteraceae bacterium]|nr:DUF1206 domain-containing protein [Caulobacteraceae bacterium]